MGDDTLTLPQPWTIQVPRSFAGLRADAFLFHALPFVSRTRIRRKVQDGEVRLNGHRCSTATRLREGDRLLIAWRAAPRPAPAVDLEILHEDGTLLAVNKPPGVPSHPMGIRQSGTVVQFARLRYARQISEHLARGDRSFYPTLANRLDTGTSGIVLVALTSAAHRTLQAMSAARRISREYIAIVEGTLGEDQGTVELPIGPCQESAVRLKMCVRADGRPSTTRWEVIERFPAYTLLRVLPMTGRQHQIRVHMAAIGHPIMGDLLYRDETLFLAAQELARRDHGGEAEAAASGRASAGHFLHAGRVSLMHPVSAARLEIRAEVPPEFEATLRRLREGREQAP